MPPAPPATEAKKKPPPPPAKEKPGPKLGEAKSEAGKDAGGKAGGDKPAPGKQPADGKKVTDASKAAATGGAKQSAEAAKDAARPDGGKPGPEPTTANERVDRMAVRAKMAVSQPGDRVEHEADQVANKVMRALDDDRSGAAKNTRPNQDTPAISREPKDNAKNPSQPTVPSDFAKDLGSGLPMEVATRAMFERQFGRDLSAVRIHADAKADAAAKQIGARAFTLGDNIAFAAGQYEPDSSEGQRLLAHELTHVVQQGDGVTRMVMRAPGSSPPGGGAAAPAGGGGPTGAAEFVVKAPLQIPPIKSRHASTYAAKAAANTLRRVKAYNAATRSTGQTPIWMAGVQIDLGRIPQAHRPAAGVPWSLPLQKQGGSSLVGGANRTAADDAALRELLKRPTWDRDGDDKSFQVDHMVEFQLGGQDDLANYELLNQEANGSVGSSFSHEINRSIRTELQGLAPGALPPVPGVSPIPANPDADFVKANYDVVFKTVQGRGRESGKKEGGSEFWSLDEAQKASPVVDLLPNSPATDLKGTAKSVSLLSPTGSLLITRLPIGAGGVTVPPGGSGGIAGFSMETVTLPGGAGSLAGTATAEGTEVGRVEGTLNLGPAVTIKADQKYGLALHKAGPEYAVKIGSTPTPGPNGTTNLIPATFVPLSPMEITDISVGKGVYGKALIHPTHPALQGITIPGQVRDGKVGVFYTVDVGQLTAAMKIPGLTVDGASVTIGYDGTDVSVGGSAAFTIRNFGQGELAAKLDTAKHFALEGRFHADPRLFDQADVKMWYRSEDGFGASGTLGITNPNKIKGIKSASINAGYEKGVFHADGSVQPNLPGVENAGLSVTYGPDASGATALAIAGDLKLAAGIPGISGGNMHVSVVQKDDAWKVSASATVTPNLPLDSPTITINYDDGLFDGKANAGFNKGIFSGTVEVGLTNRAVTPEGKLSGTDPGKTLTLYGGGSVTAKLTEQIQGGVGLQVKPTGTVLISGKIGLASSIEVFKQYPEPGADRRSLLNLSLPPIPLVGVPGAGIALAISGGVYGYAHVGPGLLTTAEISVQDFNPAQPDSLKITGAGVFNVPATAGVDAYMQAAVSAGAGIVVDAGLRLRAGVAAEARATPRGDIEWSKSAGLHLHAELNTSVTPKLKFGIDGVVSVVLGAFGVNYELWHKNWNLAEREAGSNLSIGITVPVDYYSDGRGIVFDPKKVAFQVPSLNEDTLRSLINDNGQAGQERHVGIPPG